MNILFYFNAGFDPSKGGIERVTCSVAKMLKEKGHNVFFITFIPFDKITDFEQQNQIKKFILSDNENLSSNENVNAFCEIIKSEKIDIIISQASLNWSEAELPSLVRSKMKVKLIYAIHTTPNFLALSYTYKGFPILPCKRNFIELFIKNPLEFLAAKLLQFYFKKKMGHLFHKESEKSDAIIVLSANYIPILYEMNKKIKSNPHIFAIPNMNTYPHISLNLEGKENLILFVGRISMEKHPEKAMWVWKELQNKFPDWKFKMLGDGNDIMKTDLKTLRQKWDLQRFSFEGRQDPQPYYKKAKLLFFLSDFEGFGMVLTEAMQYGVVPISFKSSEGIADIIHSGENGEIIENFKLNKFVKKAEELMNNPEKLKTKAKAAHLSTERFSADEVGEQWEEVLQKINLQ